MHTSVHPHIHRYICVCVFVCKKCILLPCEIVCLFVFLTGVSSFRLHRCTRRSECRRAEEKNGWLWSPKQQCVKIVSFYPPNLSCKKTQKVLLPLPSLPAPTSFHSSLSFVPYFSFLIIILPLPLLLTSLSCASRKHRLSNNQLPLRVRDPGLQVFLLYIDPQPKTAQLLIITQLLDCAHSSSKMESLFFSLAFSLQEKKCKLLTFQRTCFAFMWRLIPTFFWIFSCTLPSPFTMCIIKVILHSETGSSG